MLSATPPPGGAAVTELGERGSLAPGRHALPMIRHIVVFFRLITRPTERFPTQWLVVTTHPTAFVRERIRLGDTTNFLRAAGFFVTAITTAFLAEVATLYLLRIGELTQPYYWLFICSLRSRSS